MTSAEKTGHWIGTWYDGYADDNPVYEEWECSNCHCMHCGDEESLTEYCGGCGAHMIEEGR